MERAIYFNRLCSTFVSISPSKFILEVGAFNFTKKKIQFHISFIQKKKQNKTKQNKWLIHRDENSLEIHYYPLIKFSAGNKRGKIVPGVCGFVRNIVLVDILNGSGPGDLDGRRVQKRDRDVLGDSGSSGHRTWKPRS